MKQEVERGTLLLPCGKTMRQLHLQQQRPLLGLGLGNTSASLPLPLFRALSRSAYNPQASRQLRLSS